jgi:uncharacterized iron-regulated membrane protein
MSNETQAPNRPYFAVWRWHFYAGLYVIHFLLMLAVTGLVMLWVSSVTELNGEGAHVTPGATPLPVSALQSAAEAVVPGGKATQYIAPMGADRVAAFAVAVGEDITGVTLNPYTGEVVKTFPWRAGRYDFATDIHGTLLIGDTGDWLIEAAASLGPLLTVTGNVLADLRYADYSVYAKLMAWGIAFHEGDLGAWNLALNTLFCFGVIAVSLSGLVMWLKRRPAGARLGAPPQPVDTPHAKGALLITLALSLAFPMLGLTLLAVILLDLVVLAAVPPLKRLVS